MHLHIYQLKTQRHPNKHLQMAFNKDGESNFIFEIIEYVEDKNLLLEKEQYWIDKLNVCDDSVGYNICKSALSPMLGRKHSSETKLKISISNSRISNETKNKMKESHNKPVINLDTNEVFDSVKSASKFYNANGGNISKACRGIYNTSKGYRWKYIGD